MLTRPNLARALLRAGSPAFVLAWGTTEQLPDWLAAPRPLILGAFICAALWVLTGASRWQHPAWRLMSLGLVLVGLTPTLLVSATRPGPAFLWALSLLLGGYWLLWLQDGQVPARGRGAVGAVGASLGMVAVWLNAVLVSPPELLGVSSVGLSIVFALIVMTHGLWRCRQAPPRAGDARQRAGPGGPTPPDDRSQRRAGIEPVGGGRDPARGTAVGA